MSTDNNSQLLMNNLDRGTRENILKLDQKLKGLRAEIEAKLQSNSFDELGEQEYAIRLTQVVGEINEAINGIDSLVHLVATEEPGAFLQNSEIEEFSKMIEESLEKIIEIKKEF